MLLALYLLNCSLHVCLSVRVCVRVREHNCSTHAHIQMHWILQLLRLTNSGSNKNNNNSKESQQNSEINQNMNNSSRYPEKPLGKYPLHSWQWKTADAAIDNASLHFTFHILHFAFRGILSPVCQISANFAFKPSANILANNKRRQAQPPFHSIQSIAPNESHSTVAWTTKSAAKINSTRHFPSIWAFSVHFVLIKN